MIRRLLILAAALPLAACGATDSTNVRPAFAGGNYKPVPGTSAQVMGENQAHLVSLFGTANAQVTEGFGQKLQFVSSICVLDAYLYPPKHGGVPVVTHVDTRQRNGAPIDQASCIAALKRRDGGN